MSPNLAQVLAALVGFSLELLGSGSFLWDRVGSGFLAGMEIQLTIAT